MTEDFSGRVRRIVTGHDDGGRSMVVSDGDAPHIRTNPMRPGHKSTDIWRTFDAPAPITARAAETTDGPRRIVPQPKGTVVRISVIPPDAESLGTMDAEQARKVFADMGAAHASTARKSAPHPLIHRTETIDCAIVLAGELVMVLDTEEVVLRAGDVVVQNGTNHAWSNRSGKPVRIAYVLIDGSFDAELGDNIERFDNSPDHTATATASRLTAQLPRRSRLAR